MNVHQKQTRPLLQVLDDMPEEEKWEIIDGGLYCQAAAGFRHNIVRDGFVEILRPPFQRGKGGPGGWWILAEQRFSGPDPENFTLEPDLAGWRKARMPHRPEVYPDIAPDWVCEVLSAGTSDRDYGIKKRSYAKLRVQWYWIANPETRQIEVYQLFDGTYDLVDRLTDMAKPLTPFNEAAIDPSIIFDW